MEEIIKAKSFTPTLAMRNNARRGLALREKYDRGGLDTSQAHKEGVGSGVARARDIINGNLTLDTVKRMYSFFSRHEKNYQPKKKMPDGGPTAGTIAYLTWGGSAGFAWARRILKQEQILKSYTRAITDTEVNTEDELSWMKLQVNKSTNEELMQATFIVMVPNEVDLHGDITTEDEVRKAKESFNAHCMKANLFHLVQTDTFNIIESYLSPANFILDQKLVSKGTWLCTVQCLDKELWELIKSGEVCSMSIGAIAKVEEISDV